MTSNSLYTDLSGYYDLMCADINYQAQSHCVNRLHKMLGNGGTEHLDLACGTGPHVSHFIGYGYHSSGLDINQPMLDRASLRCPQAQFVLQDMCNFTVSEPVDLITCFLYSIHYSADIARLRQCIASVHKALNAGGVFCFNVVDKNTINNDKCITQTVNQDDSVFTFSSGWHYSGAGSKQALKLSIEKTTQQQTQVWRDEHAMVAFSFDELQDILKPYFEVHVFAHDYDKLLSWDSVSGNALFACVKV